MPTVALKDLCFGCEVDFHRFNVSFRGFESEFFHKKSFPMERFNIDLLPFLWR